MDKVVLAAAIGGDQECFCFVVTEEEYRRVMGEDAHQAELEDRTRSCVDERWLIYPDDLFHLLNVPTGQKVTIEIKVTP
jgi:hypothetical protein